MFELRETEYLVGPWHSPGCGRVVQSWFSRSPKLAVAEQGSHCERHHGDTSQCSVLLVRQLFKNGKLIKELS